VFQEISARADKKFSKPLLEVDARDAEIAALKAQLAAAQASPAVPVNIALTDHTLETASAAYIAQENVCLKKDSRRLNLLSCINYTG